MNSIYNIPKPVDPREEFGERHVTWVIDKTLLEGTFSENLPNVVIENGFRLITFTGDTNNYDFFDLPGQGWMDEGSGPIIAYGCHRFIKEVYKLPWLPGAYPQPGDEEANLNAPVYMVKYPSETLLNNNFIFVPILEVIRNPEFFFKIFDTNQLFVKDAIAFKRFSAKVLDRNEIVKYLSLYKDTHFIDDDSMILLSSHKPILSEHRFVIVNSNVVAHSTYRYNDILDIRIDVPQEALDFAQDMAKIWSPAKCYTIDVAMTETGPKILELNSFSCAGLYACDLQKVVLEVSRQAREDFFETCPDF